MAAGDKNFGYNINIKGNIKGSGANGNFLQGFGYEQLATAPTTNNFAGRIYENTTDGLIYKRNQANNAWDAIGAGAGAGSALLYTPAQGLTNAQKEDARQNIGINYGAGEFGRYWNFIPESGTNSYTIESKGSIGNEFGNNLHEVSIDLSFLTSNISGVISNTGDELMTVIVKVVDLSSSGYTWTDINLGIPLKNIGDYIVYTYGANGQTLISTNVKLTVPLLSGDPTSPANGETWYNTTTNKFRVRENGVTKDANSITNIETADFAANVIDTDGTLTANSDTRIASQKAVKTFVAAQIGTVARPMGGISCAANPNYPAANIGDFYRVTAAGKIGGASGENVDVGDELHCFVTGIDGTHAAVGANWTIVQANIGQASTSVIGLAALATPAIGDARTDSTKALTAASLANTPIMGNYTFGDNSASSFVITHNLNTRNINIAFYDAATFEEWDFAFIRTSANTITITTAFVPTAGQFVAVISARPNL